MANMRVVSSVALGLLAAIASGCSAPRAHTGQFAIPSAPETLRIGVIERSRTTVRRVQLDEYVQATILSEFAPPSGDARTIESMFEVQAVISRTYALAHLGRHGKEGFDVCSTTHCQLFEPARLRTSRWAMIAEDAVRRTAGRVLWFDGALASALFHADCGGRTSRAADVWGGADVPYLTAIADDGPAQGAHAAWHYEATVDAVQRALNGDGRTRIGTVMDLEIVERDAAGRAERIALRAAQPRVVRGEEFRDVLTRVFGARAIRSTQFDVRREYDAFMFDGRGFGHGVGLCQAGALARLGAGAKPAAVLSRYYPGTKLITLTPAARTPVARRH
jgi:stage II sporulation protein D